jgi:hypothetical protein
MQRVFLKSIIAVIPLFAGCAAMSGWMAGSITEGVPKLHKKLPRTVKVYFADPVNIRGYALHERSRKQVQDAFGKAFDALGVTHSTETNGCSHTLRVVVERWEYGDSGFLGSGDRNEVFMSVMMQNNDTDRVLARASLYAQNLDVLVLKYLKTLFEDEK